MDDNIRDTSVSSTDVYQIAKVVDAIKAKYIDIPEDTLTMGIYGYLSEIHTNAIQNSTIMASEYANEAIPTRAKFERNVIAHALSLGINSIQATPAYMDVMLCFPEDALLKNMKNDRFVLDSNFEFLIGEQDVYSYHIDYDILIHHDLLPNGTYIYTAMYLIDGKNKCSDLTNPYLPTMGITTITGERLVMLHTRLHQVKHHQEFKKIIVNNPLENKIMTFKFTDQLAYFDVRVVENGKEHYLNTVYDGLSDTEGNEYCNYMYLDDNTIRIKFNRDSYQPRENADVTINVWTTKGSLCNFAYNQDKVQTLDSERFSYDNIWVLIRPTSDSMEGKDKSTIEYLRQNIPKQMLLRGSVTTSTDLNNYFNFMNNPDRRLYFMERIHNQVERLYYSYILLKDKTGIIVPTNTLDVRVSRPMFSSINAINYILKTGSVFYYDYEQQEAYGVVDSKLSNTSINAMDKGGFLYINPFLTLINKNPFFAEYYLNILNYIKQLNFEFINTKSECQFIATRCNVRRLYYTERNTYTITIQMEQNVNTDFGLINTDENGNIIECKVKVVGVVYSGGDPYRYIVGNITAFDDKEFNYTFEMKFSTDDIIDKDSRIAIESGLYDIGKDNELTAYLERNVAFKFYILAELDKNYGKEDHSEIENICPGLKDFTLCNIYSVYTGIDLYYDYTDLVTSYTTIEKNKQNNFDFIIHKMPLIRYTYVNSEERIHDFIKVLENNRIYIQSSLVLLEDSFGVNFKFFNTYGPSLLYNIDEENLLNRVNLSLTFEVKFVMASDSYITENISKDVKAYMEDINKITDLHMPNLITYITNKYRNQLVYFKFLDMNGYGPVKQSIYKQDIDAFVEASTVPEFLNVNTLPNNEPDIKYIIKT